MGMMLSDDDPYLGEPWWRFPRDLVVMALVIAAIGYALVVVLDVGGSDPNDDEGCRLPNAPATCE